MRSHPTNRILDDPEVAVRVRTELAAVVDERGAYASEYPVEVRRVPRVIVDLDRDVIQSLFVDSVSRREEGVLAPDGGIGRVLEVAPPAIRPGSAHHARRNGDLIAVGSHDRFERAAFRAGEILTRLTGNVLARFNVGEQGEQRPRCQPVRPPL